MRNVRLFFFAALAAAAVSLQATTFVVPPDRDLVERADAIVLGSVIRSMSQDNGEGGIETVTTFAVSEVIRGTNVNGVVNVVEPGGTLGNVSTVIAGVPQFTPGDRLMLFLKRTGSDRWAVEELILGKFRFAGDTRGRALLLRDADEIVGWTPRLQPYSEGTRAADPFLRFVRDVAHGVPSAEDYFIKDPAPLRVQSNAMTPGAVAPAATFSATSYTMLISGNLGSRWTVFPNAVTMFTGTTAEPGAPGGGVTAAQAALASWTNDCASNVNLVYGGTDNGTHTQGLHAADGANTILFERDLSAWGISPFSCSGNGYSGTLGIGGITSAGGNNVVNGETFVTTQEADVEMNRGIANCTLLFNNGDFNTAVTHEVGHTLGFRHSDQNRASSAACTTDPSLECSNQAVMKSFVPTGINAALQPWDQNAVRAVYPGGTCGGPPPNAAPPRRGDIDGNGRSDIFWRNTSTGDNSVWYVSSAGFQGGVTPPPISAGYTLAGTGDFNHDGTSDLLWRNASTGQNTIWLMNGGTQIGTVNLPSISATLIVAGVGDVNGDGYADIFWRNTQNGTNSVWLITASGFTGGLTLATVSSASLKVASFVDLNGDGRADILWRNTQTGDVYTWILNPDGSIGAGSSFLGTISLSAVIIGTGDFNGDGTFDILWQNAQSGDVSIWFLHGGSFSGGGFDFGNVAVNGLKVAGVGDFNGDGIYDLLWRNESTGANSIWFITANGFTGGATLPNVAGTTLKIVSPSPG